MTLLLLPREDDEVSSSEIIHLLDAPTDAPGWIPLFEPRTVEALTIQDDEGEEAHVKNSGSPVSCTSHTSPFMFTFFGLAANTAPYFPCSTPDDYASFEKALTAACHRVIEAEPEITRFDTIAGDGDCGTW